MGEVAANGSPRRTLQLELCWLCLGWGSQKNSSSQLSHACVNNFALLLSRSPRYLAEQRASYNPANARRRASRGRRGLVWASGGLLFNCIAQPQPHAPPRARARGPAAPGPPTDVSAFVLCPAILFAVLPIGGEGLRSPPPDSSGKAPDVAAAATSLPPLVARMAKALSVSAGLPARSSSSSSSSSRSSSGSGDGRAYGVGRGKGAMPGHRDPAS